MSLDNQRSENEIRDTLRFVRGFATKTQKDEYVQGLWDDYVNRKNPRPLTIRVVLILFRDCELRGAPAWVMESGADRLARVLLPSLKAAPVQVGDLDTELLGETSDESEGNIAEIRVRQEKSGAALLRMENAYKKHEVSKRRALAAARKLVYGSPMGAA